MANRWKVIYCVAVSINWPRIGEKTLPHFRLETGENLPLVIMPNQEIILSQEEIELVTQHCFPDDVKAKVLLPREFLKPHHSHLIIEVLHKASKEDYFTDYPVLIDNTNELDIRRISI